MGLVINKVRKHGLLGATAIGAGRLKSEVYFRYSAWRFRDAPKYANPTKEELSRIEAELSALGVVMHDYIPSPDQFQKFKAAHWFPKKYHGGHDSGVWDEKLLEHWIAGELLQLDQYSSSDVYVDIASFDSPWAKILRERLGIAAFAVDLSPVAEPYQHLDFYFSENATHTHFADAEVRGASLQCAYEMFRGDDDRMLISELMRILRPGGKAVILPLYMHTHYCCYSSPEYFGKGFSDIGALEYIHFEGRGVPSSRKYDAQRLKDRVLDPITSVGMRYRLRVLRNQEALGEGIYCHFILEIEK